MLRARVLALVAAAAGCHSSIRYTDTRQGETRRERRPGPPRALAPAATITEAGRLRFVEPMLCGYDSVTDLATFDVDRVRPNPATLVVGVIATAAGVIAAASGLSSDDVAGDPLTYVGAAGIAVGVPMVIAPLVGNGTVRNPGPVQELRRPGLDERCGERPITAAHVTLLWSGLRAEGTADGDGLFSISPFDFVDAFDVGQLPALVFAIDLDRPEGRLRLEAVIAAADLARGRDGFFRSRGLDGTVVPLAQLRKVPQLEPGQLAISLAPGALRVSLPIDNIGPGDAYGVRLVLASSSPEIDGRILYLGRVAAHGHAVFDGSLPLSSEAERAVVSGTASFAGLVRDAHGVAPTTPVRFRGTVLRSGP